MDSIDKFRFGYTIFITIVCIVFSIPAIWLFSTIEKPLWGWIPVIGLPSFFIIWMCFSIAEQIKHVNRLS